MTLKNLLDGGTTGVTFYRQNGQLGGHVPGSVVGRAFEVNDSRVTEMPPLSEKLCKDLWYNENSQKAAEYNSQKIEEYLENAPETGVTLVLLGHLFIARSIKSPVRIHVGHEKPIPFCVKGAAPNSLVACYSGPALDFRYQYNDPQGGYSDQYVGDMVFVGAKNLTITSATGNALFVDGLGLQLVLEDVVIGHNQLLDSAGTNFVKTDYAARFVQFYAGHMKNVVCNNIQTNGFLFEDFTHLVAERLICRGSPGVGLTIRQPTAEAATCSISGDFSANYIDNVQIADNVGSSFFLYMEGAGWSYGADVGGRTQATLANCLFCQFTGVGFDNVTADGITAATSTFNGRYLPYTADVLTNNTPLMNPNTDSWPGAVIPAIDTDDPGDPFTITYPVNVYAASSQYAFAVIDGGPGTVLWEVGESLRVRATLEFDANAMAWYAARQEAFITLWSVIGSVTQKTVYIRPKGKRTVLIDFVVCTKTAGSGNFWLTAPLNWTSQPAIEHVYTFSNVIVEKLT